MSYHINNEQEALEYLQTLPSWKEGIPRIYPIVNYSLWWNDEDYKKIYKEMARISGCVGLTVHYDNLTPEYLALKKGWADELGVPFWIELHPFTERDDIVNLEADDPRYYHDVSGAGNVWSDYILNPYGSYTYRLYFCPGRDINQSQIQTCYDWGRTLLQAGITSDYLAGITIHEETVYRKSGTSWDYYRDPSIFTDCATCGSVDTFNNLLKELYDSCMDAFLNGVGFDDAYEYRPIENIYWQSGDDCSNDTCDSYVDSPWYAQNYMPIQTSTSFANYYISNNSIDATESAIVRNLNKFGLPVSPWYSVHFDESTQAHAIVPYDIMYEKAQLCMKYNSPAIQLWAFVPLDYLDPAVFSQQFIAYAGLVYGLHEYGHEYEYEYEYDDFYQIDDESLLPVDDEYNDNGPSPDQDWSGTYNFLSRMRSLISMLENYIAFTQNAASSVSNISDNIAVDIMTFSGLIYARSAVQDLRNQLTNQNAKLTSAYQNSQGLSAILMSLAAYIEQHSNQTIDNVLSDNNVQVSQSLYDAFLGAGYDVGEENIKNDV